MQLAPGVGNPGSANNPSINGGRAVTNSYVVDGIGSNDERLNTGFVGVNGSNTDLGQNVPNLVSTEAIQEYRIITSNADATFGRGSGGSINLVTKSGGNQWHGSRSLRRRFARGLDFTLAYTFGRMLDDVSVDCDFVRFPSLINLGANPNQTGVQGGVAVGLEAQFLSQYLKSSSFV